MTDDDESPTVEQIATIEQATTNLLFLCGVFDAYYRDARGRDN